MTLRDLLAFGNVGGNGDNAIRLAVDTANQESPGPQPALVARRPNNTELEVEGLALLPDVGVTHAVAIVGMDAFEQRQRIRVQVSPGPAPHLLVCPIHEQHLAAGLVAEQHDVVQRFCDSANPLLALEESASKVGVQSGGHLGEQSLLPSRRRASRVVATEHPTDARWHDSDCRVQRRGRVRGSEHRHEDRTSECCGVRATLALAIRGVCRGVDKEGSGNP